MIVEPVHERQAAEIKRLRHALESVAGQLRGALTHPIPIADQIAMVRHARDLADEALTFGQGAKP